MWSSNLLKFIRYALLQARNDCNDAFRHHTMPCNGLYDNISLNIVNHWREKNESSAAIVIYDSKNE